MRLYRMWKTCICRLCGCDSEVHDKEEAMQRWALYLLLAILLALTIGVTLWTIAIASDQKALFWKWVVALAYVIGWGHVAGSIFVCAFRDCYIRLPPSPHEPDDFRHIPPGFLGLFERLIFTVGVGVFASIDEGLGPILAAMGVWLLLKLVSGWNRAPVSIKDYDEENAFREFHRLGRGATAALLAGIVNLVFALVGGLIASDDLNFAGVETFLSGI